MFREVTAQERETVHQRLNTELTREGIAVKVGVFGGEHILIDDGDATVVVVAVPVRADELPAGITFGPYAWIPWLFARSAVVNAGSIYLSLANYLLSKGYTHALFNANAVNGQKVMTRLGSLPGNAVRKVGDITVVNISVAQAKLVSLGITPL